LGADEGLYDSLDVGDDFSFEGHIWNVDRKEQTTFEDYDVFVIFLSRVVPGKKYIIWNVYNYSFFNWNFLREQKRAE
jgi:hypothetical protein